MLSILQQEILNQLSLHLNSFLTSFSINTVLLPLKEKYITLLLDEVKYKALSPQPSLSYPLFNVQDLDNNKLLFGVFSPGQSRGTRLVYFIFDMKLRYALKFTNGRTLNEIAELNVELIHTHVTGVTRVTGVTCVTCVTGVNFLQNHHFFAKNVKS